MQDEAIAFEDFFSSDWQGVVVTCGRIVLILLVAFILARVVKRAIRRLAVRAAARQERRYAREDAEVQQRLSALREKLGGFVPTLEKSARAAQRTKTLGSTGASVAGLLIWLVAFMLCLGELHISLGPLLAGAGILGIALGFGAQSLVRDFLSGAFIIVEDQYGVGDVVDIGEATGVVEEVTLRVTRVRGVDGTMWHVPNGEIKRAGNMSHYWARVVLDVPVAYDADVKAASEMIKRVADEMWHAHETTDILEEPELWGIETFGENSMAVRLAVKTLPATQWLVARELRARIKAAFDREGFEMPSAQRVMWTRSPADEGDTAADPSAPGPDGDVSPRDPERAG